MVRVNKFSREELVGLCVLAEKTVKEALPSPDESIRTYQYEVFLVEDEEFPEADKFWKQLQG
jgi:hypothetical protein